MTSGSCGGLRYSPQLIWRLPSVAAANMLIEIPQGELSLTNSSVEVYRLVRARWKDLALKISKRSAIGFARDRLAIGFAKGRRLINSLIGRGLTCFPT